VAAKLRIDLKAGVLEAEGEDQFVLEVYRDFQERHPNLTPAAIGSPRPAKPPRKERNRFTAT